MVTAYSMNGRENVNRCEDNIKMDLKIGQKGGDQINESLWQCQWWILVDTK